jgi:uncharacterized protein YcbK (DUF882 family)
MKSFKLIIVILVLSLIIFFAHFNNTKRVNPVVADYYYSLKESLREKGYTNNLLVISTKRSKWENNLFKKISVAAPDSHHLTGNAIDILVCDINKDGKINGKDVDIVYQILDKEIVMNKGGIGIYKNKGLLTRQMVHFDYRGERTRWNY